MEARLSTNVLLVSSWGVTCGIAAHSEELIKAVEATDPTLQHYIDPAHLDPAVCFNEWQDAWKVTVLNYHRALHSRWTVDRVRQLQERSKVIVVWHDSFGQNDPDQLSQDLCEIADGFVVHEPVIGLPKAIYWRQGVPSSRFVGTGHSERARRPILGSIGFDFGWKGFDRICVLAKQSGWGVLLLTPEMSEAREAELRVLNPWLSVRRNRGTLEAIADLRECDATAFLYVCGNSGTSAAIRMGIAAGKPVIAYSTCRQFRDLVKDPLGAETINWVENEAHVTETLQMLPLSRLDAGIVALAEQDSWKRLGEKYAELYRKVANS